jgi:cytochrome c biogenesis protein
LSVDGDGQREIYLGGRTNRAQVAFEREILAIAALGQSEIEQKQ